MRRDPAIRCSVLLGRIFQNLTKRILKIDIDNQDGIKHSEDMKAIFSPLAERQTVRVNNINARVAVRVREWKSGEQTETTNDVMVDGYCYTPAVSDNWLSQNLAKICDIVAGKTETHYGMGQWA